MIKTIKSKRESRSYKLTKKSELYQAGSKFLNTFTNFLPSQKKYDISISLEKKFVWFRIAKVGSKTIYDVLDKARIELDVDDAYDIYYPYRKYQDFFKFAFVRNPWDRLVSCWSNKVLGYNYFNFPEDERKKLEVFENFVDYVSGMDIKKCDLHLRIQSESIDLNNIDFLGRFENFENDLNFVLEKIGVNGIKIEKINQSNRKKDYRKYYNESTMKKVADLYSRDINIFSYRF